MRGEAFELLHEVRRLNDLSRVDEQMDVVGHDLHLSDGDAEAETFVPHKAPECMFNFSIYQFLSILGAPYQVIADIVHAMC